MAAVAAWQVLPLVEIEGGFPVLCGYVYQHADGFELKVEKGVRGDAVFTALEANGADAIELVTASFDSRRDLRVVAPAKVGGARLEGDLQEVDAGGALFVELGVSGGSLRVGRRDATSAALVWQDYPLPAPLPRGVTAMYLNCAGDLIRPE